LDETRLTVGPIRVPVSGRCPMQPRDAGIGVLGPHYADSPNPRDRAWRCRLLRGCGDRKSSRCAAEKSNETCAFSSFPPGRDDCLHVGFSAPDNAMAGSSARLRILRLHLMVKAALGWYSKRERRSGRGGGSDRPQPPFLSLPRLGKSPLFRRPESWRRSHEDVGYRDCRHFAQVDPAARRE
jgi:hypothetical protein